VISPHAGRSRGLARARRALNRQRVLVVQELEIEHVDRLPELLRTLGGEPRLVIAAGGDGTVGSVAGHLAGTDNMLGILPLGTGNDFARSLDIPLGPRRAARLLGTGEISNVDLGRFTRPGHPPAYFAHAATVGLNVDFAKLATRASVRRRLGRLTYLAAAVYALRARTTFTCTLRHDGIADELSLLQLSVISAPVIGGALGLTLRGPRPAEHRLDVLAVEDVPPPKMLRAGLFLLLGVHRPVRGVRALQVERLCVDSPHPLGLSLDGELGGNLPGQFELVEGVPARGHPAPLIDQPSACGDDLDLVCDAANTGQRRDGVERGVILVLVLDLSLEGQPTVGDSDVNPVGRHRVVRHQRLQRRTADLVVLPAIPGVNPELVLDGADARHGARDLDDRSTLVKGADAAAQCHRAIPL
jgi:diacylglycerol kinase (ATP)